MSEEILGRIREWCAADPALEFGEGDPPTVTLTEDQPFVLRVLPGDAAVTLSHTVADGRELTRTLDAGTARLGFMGAVYDLAATAAGIAAEAVAPAAEAETEAAAEPAAGGEAGGHPAGEPEPAEPAAFVATHRVPPGGMTAWSVPDGSTTPIAKLSARVELRIDEERGAWAKVVGSNGWTGWVDGRRLEPIIAAEPEPQPQPEARPEPEPVAAAVPAAPAPPPGETAFNPTHRVPAGGMAAWAAPDPAQQPAAQLQARVELRIDEERGAWAKVVGSNGWTGWVDGRRLEPMGSARPAGLRSATGGVTLSGLPMVALAGVVALVVAAFLPWVQGFANNSLDWPIESLWSSDELLARVYGGDVGAFTIGIVVLVLAAAGLAAAVLPQVPAKTGRVAGLLAIVVAALFGIQLILGIQDIGGSFGDAFTDGINVGVWVTLAGGVLMLVGGKARSS